jgi:carbon monoxide dehydrogenase subunit G
MEINNEMRVDAPIEKAWALLTDIPAIAPCLPGAELTGENGDEFAGRMKVKVGPITAEYSGTARIAEMNEADRTVQLTASGRDSRGAGNASANITAAMKPDGSGTVVTIATDLKISGKVAQFGRGVMADISKKLLDQFADCIEQKLATAESSDEKDGARTVEVAPESSDDALELLDVAGAAIAKRLIPLIVVLVIVVLLLLAVL